ncbi:MAG: hypothetical protein IIT58_02805 [Treponema sp.]|nr:hypothetical protein [Treponema sp.]
MQDFNEILENIKFFLQENKKKTIFICSLLIFMTFCAVIVLSISGKKKKLPPIEPQKELVIDQKLLIPDGPVVPDGYITERKTQKNWSKEDIEKWFTTPTEQEIQKLSDTNDRTVSEIIGAAP